MTFGAKGVLRWPPMRHVRRTLKAGRSAAPLSAWAALVFVAAALSACGGGGGGGSSPTPETQPQPESPAPAPEPEPPVTPEPTPEPTPDPEPPPELELPTPPPTPEPLAELEPEPEPEPEPPAEPDPPAAPTADQLGAAAAVRAHATESTADTPEGHPAGARTTVYRAEILEPATNPRSAASWETAEYERAGGLTLIDAGRGYAARTTGRPGGGGITIAFVGRRIPTDNAESFGHPDLEGVTLVQITDHDTVEDTDHETKVAGIAAARRNGFGMHGVAYNAGIVSVPITLTKFGTRHVWSMEGILASIAGVAGTYDGGAWGRDYDSDPAASAHVANLSILMDPRLDRRAVRGMAIMAREGRVMVAALGNESDPNPIYPPASEVTRPEIAGHAIAVGALNSAGTAPASWSTRCGNVKRYCIFAPGEDVVSTSGSYSDTDRGFTSTGGTSGATPYVSGAVAAVWAAFPNKTGAQVVERILSTARQVDVANGDYDSEGLSPIYGHGALDLGAALNPVGFTSLPTRESRSVPVQRSFVDLPPVFGFRPTAALRDAIVYDTQMFPFLHDLNGAVRMRRAHPSTSIVDDFLSPPRYGRSSKRLGDGVRLGFAWSKRDRADRDPEIHDYVVRVAATPSLSFRFGRSAGVSGASGGFVSRRLARGPIRQGFVVGPFSQLAGEGATVGVDWRRDERTRLDFVGKTGSGWFGGGRAQLASLGVTHRLGSGLILGARYGALRERGALLGVRGSGAFADAPGARTDFLELGLERRIAGAALFGSVSWGTTRDDAAGAGSLIAGWSGGQGESFAVGGEWSDLWRDSDRLTVSLSSPFRPRGAGMYVDVPDRELADGVTAFTRHRVDLSPRGREMRLQLTWEADAAPGAAATLGGFARLNPDHDPNAGPEFGAAAKMRLDF